MTEIVSLNGKISDETHHEQTDVGQGPVQDSLVRGDT